MKPNFTKCVLAMLFLMLGVYSTQAAALSGNYTIGKSGDYTSVTAAVSDLTSNGVSGPVTFTIDDGTYSGTLSFGSGISGASSTNTITFMSKSMDSTKVTITSSSYTVYMTGADYINFEGMTFYTTSSSYNVYLTSGSDYNTFKNCRMTGSGGSYPSYHFYVNYSEYNKFINTRVLGGYYGFYFYGSGSGSSASKGNMVKGCTITQHYYYGCELYYNREFTFENNYIDSCQNNGYGLMAYYSDAFTVRNNEILGCYYGLYMYYHNQYGSSSDTSKFYNNIIRKSVYYGMYSYYVPRCNFYHNVFEGGASNYSALFQYAGGSRIENNIFLGDGLYYGFYCYYSSSGDAPATWDYNDYWFTNYSYFGVMASSAYSSLSSLQSSYSNYFQHAVTVDPGFVSATDGRTYAPGLNNVGHHVNVDGVRTDIDGNKRPNSADGGKVDIGCNDFYLSPYDLDVYALVSPLSVNPKTNTITAQFRNSGSQTITSTDVYVQYSVDSGKTWITDTLSISSLAPGKVVQFDFTKKWKPTRSGYFTISIRISKSVSGDPDLVDRKDYKVCSGLAGTFTIGKGAKADYATFGDAVKALNCGVAGPIVFNVQSGTYTERIVLNTLQGASATNTVTFHSAHIDSVTLQYNASSNSDQNTVQFNGADYVAFENMRIEADGGSYGYAVHMMNQSNYNRIEGCVVQGNTGSTSSYSGPLVISGNQNSYYTSGDNANYCQFLNNQFLGGYYGVVVYGSSTSQMSTGNQFIGNDFLQSYYYSTYFYYVSDLVFQDNRVEKQRYTYNYACYWIYLSNIDVQRNYFNSYYGNICEMINYYNYKGTRSIIANNMYTGTNSSYAFDGYYMSYVDFWHNSLYGKGSYLTYWYYVTDIDVRNNIFYYEGSNYAIYAPYINSFREWDYNDYYIASGNAAYVASNVYSSVSAMKAYSATMNQNNFEEDPQWVDPTSDLHVTSKFPEMYGANVGVELDFDQDKRCKFAPT
ncbi:hypothetical protein GC194_10085, partial [bacterium]|nr:hypothetical protein [bacterium]